MINHTERHTGITFYCDSCAKVFYSKADLSCHAQLSHGFQPSIGHDGLNPLPSNNVQNNVSQGLELRKCYKCDTMFQTYECLKTHMVTDHVEINSDEPTHVSNINNCSNENDTLEELVITWSNNCDICDYKAYSESDLHKHIQTMHESIATTCKFCKLIFESVSKLNHHIHQKHKEAQPTIISPITQLDGFDLDSFDFDNENPNTSRRTTNYKLNQIKQTGKIIKDANKSDYDIVVNNNEQNSTIRCSSGFYVQVGRPCFSSLENGSVLNTSSIVITVDDITKTSDLNGTETNLIMLFSFKNSLQTCGGVRVHLHHSTRTIQM